MSNKLIQNLSLIGKAPLNNGSVFEAAEDCFLCKASGYDFFSSLRFLFFFLHRQSFTFFSYFPSTSKMAYSYFSSFPFSFLSSKALIVIYLFARSQPTSIKMNLWQIRLWRWSRAWSHLLHMERRCWLLTLYVL